MNSDKPPVVPINSDKHPVVTIKSDKPPVVPINSDKPTVVPIKSHKSRAHIFENPPVWKKKVQINPRYLTPIVCPPHVDLH